MQDKTAPDPRELFARKAEARLERARLPYGEKVRIVEKMRRELLPLRAAMRSARERTQVRTVVVSPSVPMPAAPQPPSTDLPEV